MRLCVQLVTAFVFCFALIKGTENKFPKIAKRGLKDLINQAYILYQGMPEVPTPIYCQELQNYAREINRPTIREEFEEKMDPLFVIALAASVSLGELMFLNCVKKAPLTLQEPNKLEIIRCVIIPVILEKNELESRSFLYVQLGNMLTALKSISFFLSKSQISQDPSLNDLFDVTSSLEIALDILDQYKVQGLIGELSLNLIFYKEVLNMKLNNEMINLKMLLANLTSAMAKENPPENALEECKELAKTMARTGGTYMADLLENEPISFRIAFLLCLTEDYNEQVFLDKRIYNLLSLKKYQSRNDLFPVVEMAMTNIQIFENLNDQRVLSGSIDMIIARVFEERSAN